MTAAARGRLHPQSRRMTAKARIVVMTIVPVTATPYAAARLLDVLNQRTSATVDTSRPWLTSGM